MRIERWTHTIPLRLRSLFRRTSVERELDEELQFHLERQIEQNMARGLAPDEARYAALRALGGVEQRKEECRDTRRMNLIDEVSRDVLYAGRLLRRSPGFTSVALLSLALGIGANTAIFQLLDAVRLRSLPVQRPSALAVVQIAARGWPCCSYGGRYPDLTYPQWERVRDAQQAFEAVMAWGQATFDLAPRGESRFVENGLWVSGDFFTVLGVTPQLGRLFTTTDDVRGCGNPGIVLSHAFWQREMGGAASAVGSTLTVKGHPLPVIGVTPAGFFGVEVGRSFDLALPLCADALINGDAQRLDARPAWWLAAMGRLRPGWTLAQATAHLQTLSPAVFAETLPSTFSADDAASYRAFRLEAVRGDAGFSQLRQDYDRPLALLLALAVFVLLIACANLANLMLARMGARSREMAARLALGASRNRLVRQLLVESLLLAAIGAAIGVWLAPVLSRSIVVLIGTDVSPMFVDLATDWRLIGFTAGLAVSTCVLFGLAPAVRATRVSLGDAMKASGRSPSGDLRQSTLRRALVVAQVALSVVLLVGGLLFGRSLYNLVTLDAGFQQTGILEADLDFSQLTLSVEGRRALRQHVLDRVRAVPGVQAAGAASNVPLVGKRYNEVFIDGRNGRQKYLAHLNRVTDRYFETLQITLMAGRDFNDGDVTAATGVVIVNEAFATTLLGGPNAVGRTFHLQGDRGQPGRLVQVVGVVSDTKYSNLREEFPTIVYVPESQHPRADTLQQILVRSSLPLTALQPAVKRAIETASPAASFHFHDFHAQVGYSLRQDRLMATLCGFFALLGALLATVGVYGVSAYSVTQRTGEFGIRLALGADRRAIVALVLREAVWLLGISLAAGTALALAVSRSARTLLFGLEPTDPAAIILAVVLIGAVAGLATYLPARRAARVDPTVALRCE